MKILFIISLPLFLLLSVQVYSEEKAPVENKVIEAPKAEKRMPTDYFLICKNLKIVRTLRVEASPQKCMTYYTKLGEDRNIGSSQRGVENCRQFANQVRDTLVKAGWKCKEIKSGVSHLNE